MPYRDPEKRKEFKHRYYIDHKQEIIKRTRQYREEHPDRVKIYYATCNQEKNAPYHRILDEAGVERVCAKCGSTSGICTHHVDGNHHNNSLNNLQWLCMSCHGRLHRQQQLSRS